MVKTLVYDIKSQLLAPLYAFPEDSLSQRLIFLSFEWLLEGSCCLRKYFDMSKKEGEDTVFFPFITHSLKPEFLLNGLVSLFCDTEQNCKEKGSNCVGGGEGESRNSQKCMDCGTLLQRCVLLRCCVLMLHFAYPVYCITIYSQNQNVST